MPTELSNENPIWINHWGFQNHKRLLLGHLMFAGGLIDFSLSKGKFCKSRAAAVAVGADGAFFGEKLMLEFAFWWDQRALTSGVIGTWIARHFSPWIGTSPRIPWKMRPYQHTVSSASSFKCFCNSMQRNADHCDIYSKMWVSMGLKGCRRNPKSQNSSSRTENASSIPEFKLTDARHERSEETMCKPVVKAEHVQLGFADAELSEVSKITMVIPAFGVSSGLQSLHFKFWGCTGHAQTFTKLQFQRTGIGAEMKTKCFRKGWSATGTRQAVGKNTYGRRRGKGKPREIIIVWKMITKCRLNMEGHKNVTLKSIW